jgi:hypothetical protein
VEIDSPYVFEIHIDYDFLKYTDLEWLYSDIRHALSTALKDPEVQEELSRVSGTPRVLVESMNTDKSIDIQLTIASVKDAAGLVAYVLLLKKTYEEYRKKKMEEERLKKRRTRRNIRVKTRLRRRFEHGVVAEEELEEWYEYSP